MQNLSMMMIGNFMGIRKLKSWAGSWFFSSTAEESGGRDAELVHDDDRPGNKKRKTTHDSIVIYDHDQGSSTASSSLPIICPSDGPVCYKKWAINYKTNQLFARALDVRKEIEYDEIQPKKRRRMEVQHWLKAVDQFRDEVQNIATDDQSMENLSLQVDELLQRGNFPHGYVLPDDSPIELPLPAKNPAGKMFALNTATILEWLKNNERCIIGVHGMGGVGKTTMLRWLYNEVLKQKDIFGHPYWVTVSQNCSKLKLQNDIAKELGVDRFGEGDDDRKRATILHRRLSKMGPIVLFLDDMWEWNPFIGMDIEFPIEGSSCKIIISSRLYKVCKEMGCKGFVINAKVLPEYEAWNLFVEKLGHYDKLTEEVKGIARLIAKECGGLPLAIATMARSMSEVVDVRVWNDALNELRQSSCAQGDMEEYVFSVLKYSYNHLNDWILQNCFLSCVLYPEDYRIHREELIDGWIMEGLLDEVGSRSNQVNKGHTILNKLINSCLLEIDGVEGVKMHDLMRDMAIMITKGNLCFMAKSGHGLPKVPEEEQWSKDLVKVSLSHNRIKEIPNGMAPLTPRLTVLMLNNNTPLSGIPESFFIHMRALTVLDLSKTDIERLPESVSDLENLRVLLLANCTRLRYVTCLAKLSKLRVLDLYEDYNLEKAPEGIERLTCLEKITYCPWDISDITGFNNLIQSLTSLSCYRFYLCDDPVRCNNDRSILYSNENIENLGCAVKVEKGDDKTSYLLPATIQNLVIVECAVKRRSLGDVFPTLVLATELRDLYIRNCKGLKYILSSSLGPQQGPSLENMCLRDLPDLRGIIEFGGCTFSHLCRLEISGCPKIKVLFDHSEKHLSLPNLKYLKVLECEELEEIFDSNNGNHLHSAFGLPNLVTLVLSFLPKLQRLFTNRNLCASLEELRVRNCQELEEIFESGGSNCLSLSLTLRDPVDACNPEQKPICVLSKLKKIRLDYLPNLRSIYKNLHLCTSLQYLQVVDCPKIEKIFETPELILALRSLMTLKLSRLPKMSSIHRGLLLCPSLHYLCVDGCLKLKKVPFCDSPQSLTIQLESDNPELLELLRREHAEDARSLSDYYMQYYVSLPKLYYDNWDKLYYYNNWDKLYFPTKRGKIR